MYHLSVDTLGSGEVVFDPEIWPENCETPEEDFAIRFLLAELDEALDRALGCSRHARIEIDQTLALIRERNRRRVDVGGAANL